MPEPKTVMQPVRALTAGARTEQPYLIVITGRSAGRMFRLRDDDVVIGRSADEASIVLEDDGVSRRHCRITRQSDGTVQAVDLGSTNGTYFNGARIDVATLHDGDKIQLGSTTILKFSYQDEVEEQFQKQLYESASRDGLTQSYNKKYFLDRLRHEFAYCWRHRVELSLCMIDLDRFKEVNDTFGHAAGDEALIRLAGLVSDTVRTEDVFARYGGEEFAVILRQIDIENAFVFGERLRKVLETTEFKVRDTTGKECTIHLTASIGIAALHDRNYSTPEELVLAADRCLYRAKQAGRNKVSKDPD
ncbi:MAG TPA: GGDEF domain-containing protein [Vicinamibacterales bacterium]|jgi:two-component system cell cycle response regulator|nr:GGDEF domain-containing protein [Vicinamibacterales bacterium]